MYCNRNYLRILQLCNRNYHSRNLYFDWKVKAWEKGKCWGYEEVDKKVVGCNHYRFVIVNVVLCLLFINYMFPKSTASVKIITFHAHVNLDHCIKSDKRKDRITSSAKLTYLRLSLFIWSSISGSIEEWILRPSQFSFFKEFIYLPFLRQLKISKNICTLSDCTQLC